MKKIVSILIIIIGLYIINIPFVYAKESIEIKSISVSEQSSTISIDELSFDNNTISSEISFNQVNDFVTFDVEIENNSNIDYIFDSIKNNINSDYLLIESENMGNTIKKNSNDTIRIKIKYNNELQNHDDIHLNNVSFSLNFKNPTILVNPLTARNIIIFIVAIIILVLSFYAIKNKKSKVLLLLLLLIPTFVYAAESNNVELKFDNITIKGRYLQYRVSIDNGNDIIENDITYGNPIGDLPDITPRNGYNNDGWIDQNNNVITSETIVTEDLLINPKYNPIDYNITYDLNGGTLSNNNKIKYTVEDEFVLNNPTKVGYTFAGWSSDGGETFQTSVTIPEGTTGDLNFVAYFSANEDTKYTVIHNKMNLNGVYEEAEREELHGATDTPVTPDRRNYEGFIIPEGETKSINGDGTTTFIYNYERIRYDFSITDRAYIDSTSTVDGNYYYGTTITIKANSRVGYTFRWSDNNTNLERSFELKSNLTLTPIYTPNTNTAYKVIHKTMNLDGSTYTVRDEMNYTGTTDSNITPAVNTYEGFTKPQTQTVKINGDGSTVVEYLYTRNKYTLTLENSEFIETTITPGEYYYGTSITLSAKERNKYTFVKWSNNNTNSTITFTLTNDTTIGPVYIENGHVITFDSNGGSNVEDVLIIEPNHEIGDLPVPERYGYYLDGWYTLPSGGIEVPSDYIPTDDMVLYAKWKKSIEIAIITNSNITIAIGTEESIIITNSSEIEEDYTFSSNDESIATVDQNGKVIGVAEGTATITITGTKSNKTKTINVTVIETVVAKINSTNYKTLQEALNSANTDDEVLLLVDRTEDVTNNKKITLNLNNHIITGQLTNNAEGDITLLNGKIVYSESPTIINNGKLTIGSIDQSIDDGAEIECLKYSYNDVVSAVTILLDLDGASVTLNKGTIKSHTSSIYGNTKVNNVTIVINGGNIITTSTEYFAYGISIYKDSTVTMNGGSITTSSHGYSYGITAKNIIMNGGNISVGSTTNSSSSIFNNAGLRGTNVTMNAGNINVLLEGTNHCSYGILVNSTGTATMNGGTIISQSEKGNSTGIAGGWSDTANIIVNGGNITSISNSTSQYDKCCGVGSGYESDSNITINGGNIQAIANGVKTFGIYGEKNVTINSGVIKATSNTTTSYGMYSYNGTLTMNGGMLYSKGNTKSNSIGIQTTSKIYPENKTLYQETDSNNYEVYYLAPSSSDFALITLDPNTGSVTPTSMRKGKGEEIGTLPIPIKENYDFDGWYTSATGGTKVSTDTVFNSSTTIYAHWRESGFLIEFEENGGTAVADIILNKGDPLTNLPTPYREGKEFDGWHLLLESGPKIENGYIPTSNLKLYAVWKDATN